MMLVRTRVAPSKIHGLGLFADEFIPKGTVLWKYVPGFDLRLSEQDIKKLPTPVQEYVLFYDYISPDTGYHILCTDNARFYNHSKDPNTIGIDLEGTDGEGGDITIKDIQKGEEITCDYEKADRNYRFKLREIRIYALEPN